MKSYLLGAAAAAAIAASPALAQEHASHSTAPPAEGADIVRAPADLPAPLPRRGPQTVKVHLDTIEVTGRLDDGATYRYWTYN
jgi:nitrite reductase (NO-forming)